MNLEKHPMQIYLALGSNLGNRLDTIESALKLINERIDNLELSSVYETEPWGVTKQPEFLNLCISGTTNMDPDELLRFVKDIEIKLGRKHRHKWGPREIDIDILFCGDKIIQKADLSIPHPYLQDRAFVLVPLNDIAPNFIHPVIGKSIKDLLMVVDKSGVNKINSESPIR